MKTPDEIYAILEKLNCQVKENLRKKGVVVPIRQNNETICIGKYIVKKNNHNFYRIVDQKDRTIIDMINLPQTAILLANKLELGKWIDTDLLQNDKKYGYFLFDEVAHNKTAKFNIRKKNHDKAEIMFNKSEIAKHRKEYYKNSIVRDFQKLIDFR